MDVTSLAFIINEAVTILLKTFPGNRKVNIKFNMELSGDKVTLMIANDGFSIDPSILSTMQKSLGLKLIQGLSARINAELVITTRKEQL